MLILRNSYFATARSAITFIIEEPDFKRCSTHTLQYRGVVYRWIKNTKSKRS